MYVLLSGLNHRTAPVEIREKIALGGAILEDAYNFLKESEQIEGAVILTTCNRTEVYATTRDVQNGLPVLANFMEKYSGIIYRHLKKHLYQPTCYDAVRHLFQVSSGLDSMILGESQILAQVKDAYQKAIDVGASDSVLNALFQKAIYVGKRVRTDTCIRHPLSVSSAAVELAREKLGDIQGKTVLIVGAGEMSELATRYLLQNGVQSVIVSNRSYDKALLMAESFNGKAVRFNDLPAELLTADIVISCTGARHYVIGSDNCRKFLRARQGREILMIDIAVPRDIDPTLREIEGVFIHDIDDLRNVVEANYKERQKAVQQAQQIISRELEAFQQWLAALYVVPVITALRQQGEKIKENELKRAFNRLGKVSEQEEKVITAMAHAMVNQLLHYPVVNLKEMAASNQGHMYAEVVKKLFNLQIDMGEGSSELLEAGNQR